MKKPFLFVGLDYEDPNEVLDFAKEIGEVNREDYGFKLNLDFFINGFLTGNIGHFHEIIKMQRPIFADLKMWNGRRTMVSIVEQLASRGVDYTNIYSFADKPFLEAVVEATKNTNTKILGVTVLTHYDNDYCQKMRGCSFSEAVRKDAEVAYNAGCQGIILPGNMLEVVADLEMEKLVPAVRPEWYGKTGDNYQEQEVYVRDAVKNGADLLVCSSPIRKNKNRKEALIRTLDEMY